MIDPVSTPINVSALQGMHNAQAQLQTAASKIAQAPAALQSSQPADRVDLSDTMVAMLSARDDFSANAASYKTGDQMQRDLLNMVA